MDTLRKKSDLQKKAIDFQNTLSEKPIGYFDLMKIQYYFCDRAARYHLINEFKENGII